MNADTEYKRMTETPIKKLVTILAIPCVISMLVSSIYNFADTFFVSRLGESASGAVGVVFSIMAIIQAIGFTLGMGSGANISAKLGEKDNKEASLIASSAFFLALVLGLLVTLFGLIFLDPLMKVLGATDTVLPYAKNYATYILIGSPIMMGTFVLNNQLRAEGKARLSMVGITIGGFLNIGLDPLFIFVFDLGIKGAAIATLISQSVSFIILLSFFIFKKSVLHLSLKGGFSSFRRYVDVVRLGLPSLCRQGLASLATVLLNRQAGLYGGDSALAAMSIVTKVFMIVNSVVIGIGQGFQPVAGYNYATKKFSRVKEAYLFAFILDTIVMALLGTVFFIFSKEIIFLCIGNNDDVINIGKMALRYQCISMPLLALNTIVNMAFQSTRMKWKATLLSSCRQGIFFIPLVYILPSLLKVKGVTLVQPLADVATFVFSIPFFIWFLHHLKSGNNEKQLVKE